MNLQLVIKRKDKSNIEYFFKICVFNSIFFCREKKREKERDELWKKLAELELNHNKNVPAQQNNSPPNKK